MRTVRVDGEREDHRVMIYALSTCGWCKMTKEFMKDHGVAFEYVHVDEATMDEKREIGDYFKEKNLRLGFPVTVVDDVVFVIGYKPDDLREALGL